MVFIIMMKTTKLHAKRRRIRGITPVLATIIMLGVTLTVAFAAWAWARGATGSTENNFNNSTGQNINQLKERLAIPTVNFSSTLKNKVTVWLYNDGNITTNVVQVWVSNSTYTWCAVSTSQSNPPPQCTTTTGLPVNLPQGNLAASTFTASSTNQFNSGSLYTIKVLATYGNTFTYTVAR
jgi:flagellin-like protein